MNPSNPRNPGSVIVFASALLLFPTIFWPFDYDQGTFAYGGWAVLHGLRPYIDFWDIKPPNIFYTYAAAFALFGNTVRAVRLFDYLNALLTIALLYRLATRLWKDSQIQMLAAVFGSLAFIVQYYIFGHWDTAQTETYSLPLLIGAALCVIPSAPVSDRRIYIRSAIAGMLLGISFYFKYPNGIFLPLIAAAVLLYIPKLLRIRSLFCLLAGFAAWIALESGYLALNHELLPLWRVTTSETASYVTTNYSGSFTIFNNLRASSQAIDLTWIILGGIGCIAWIFYRKTRGHRTVDTLKPLVWSLFGVVLALIAVQAGNKGYKYHYAVALPWADLLIGYGIAWLIVMVPKRIRLPQWGVVTITFILLSTISYFVTSSYQLQSRSAELLRIASGNEPANGYIATDSLSNYVVQHSRPTDRIFIFGFQPYVYWKSGRTPATKFLNTIHFKPTTVPKAERDELVSSLLQNPPELFLVEVGDHYTSQGNTNQDSQTTIQLRYPELQQLLLEKYWPIDTFHNNTGFAATYIIYQKR